MTKYMACFALFTGVFYKMINYEIYLPQLIEKLHNMIHKICKLNAKFKGENFKNRRYLQIYPNVLFILF